MARQWYAPDPVRGPVSKNTTKRNRELYLTSLSGLHTRHKRVPPQPPRTVNGFFLGFETWKTFPLDLRRKVE